LVRGDYSARTEGAATIDCYKVDQARCDCIAPGGSPGCATVAPKRPQQDLPLYAAA